MESLNKNGKVQDLINFVNEKKTEAEARNGAVTDGKHDLPGDRMLLPSSKRKVYCTVGFHMNNISSDL